MPILDAPNHGDPGLQPERTDLAWGRTTLALVVAAAVFLRWIPHHGWFTTTLVLTSALTALAISVTRKQRVHRAVNGIRREESSPDVLTAAAMAASVGTLAILGICTILLTPVES
ncbi:DUF202 domain-containing protein [Paenarthrobacter ureafaciens]|jgi:uncharacterized membrane protein YidH (DUF202 family)|uniref:DUF202 domain-containing protein n=1 Tax=Paenarthrobacter ureafaciens TaxID=37931 RepID=UPI001FB4AE61|nr:DUF202 domain-containing protein [Paenarthrobacter ureafaciens]UOD81209.1 DUF202 domain-containing protein [Paenarthrobacter ureafaciens]WNZ03859.1 DUF202 domain-containing protein [Paenarthrobacter ureafaciens]